MFRENMRTYTYYGVIPLFRMYSAPSLPPSGEVVGLLLFLRLASVLYRGFTPVYRIAPGSLVFFFRRQDQARFPP